MAWTKVIVVVDEDVNVHDETAVLRAIFENCDFQRDLEVVNGPLDILDHASPRLGAGHKLGIDATRKIAGEEVAGVPVGDSPATGSLSELDVANVPVFGRDRCMFVGVQKNAAGDGARAIERAFDAGADFVIAVDDSVDLADRDAVLFHWCANFDPGRDMHRRDHRVGFDATSKVAGDERGGQPVRDFPPILEMSEEIRDRVTSRWSEYGL